MPLWPRRGLHDAILCRVAVARSAADGTHPVRRGISSLAAADRGGGDWRRCRHGHGAGCAMPSSAAWRLTRSA